MKNTDELFIVVLLYSFIILVPLGLLTLHKKNHELIETKKLALILNIEKQSLYIEAIDILEENQKLRDKLKHQKLLKDLLTIRDYNLRMKTVLLCSTESSLNYNVIHKGVFDSTTAGICGIKTHWIDIIPELNQENINSLYAGSLVLDYLLKKYNGNNYLAIKEYKGAIKNLTTTDKVIALFSKYNLI